MKLLDFGIAKARLADASARPLTVAGAVFGTPGYLAPEQALGGDADGRADLYSLGVVLYELLAGAPPFDDRDVMELLRRQLCDDPQPLRRRAPGAGIPPEVEGVVTRAMMRDAERRFQAAEEMGAALRACLPARQAPPRRRARLSAVEARDRLQPLLDREVVVGRVPSSMTPTTAFVLSRVGDGIRVDDLLAVSGLPHGATCQLVEALIADGVLVAAR